MKASIIGLGVVAVASLAAAPALASHHKKAPEHHHASAKHVASKHASSKHETRHHEEARKPSAPSGATNVPAGGIKLYCGPGKSPLMVRKMTQGAGTTVTVICR